MAGTRKLGCFGYGCLISLVLSVALALVLGFFLVRQLRSAVTAFTASDAQILAPVSASEEVARSGRDKLAQVREALRNPQGAGTFDLSADELNGALASDPSLAPLRDHIRFELPGNEMQLTVSSKLSDVGEWPALDLLAPGNRDRYLNGAARGVLGISGSQFTVKLSSLVLGGNTFPESALNQASGWLAGALNSMSLSEVPDVSLPSRFSSIAVVDGRLSFTIVATPSASHAQP